MFRESLQTKTARLKKIIAGFQKAYPKAHCELTHADPLQLLISTILSAQCTDKRVNIVTKTLFQKYRSAKDFANAEIAALENDVRSTGFYKNKARNIKAASRDIVKKHGGKVPQTMDELLELGGVGRKTANVVLGNAFGINVGMVVDTHVARLSRRLGLTRQTTPEKIEQELMKVVPREDWIDFSHLLIWHGRKRCNARRPNCIQCEVADLCPKIGVRIKGDGNERT